MTKKRHKNPFHPWLKWRRRKEIELTMDKETTHEVYIQYILPELLSKQQHDLIEIKHPKDQKQLTIPINDITIAHPKTTIKNILKHTHNQDNLINYLNTRHQTLIFIDYLKQLLPEIVIKDALVPYLLNQEERITIKHPQDTGTEYSLKGILTTIPEIDLTNDHTTIQSLLTLTQKNDIIKCPRLIEYLKGKNK